MRTQGVVTTAYVGVFQALETWSSFIAQNEHAVPARRDTDAVTRKQKQTERNKHAFKVDDK